jgi:hypothetical protein
MIGASYPVKRRTRCLVFAECSAVTGGEYQRIGSQIIYFGGILTHIVILDKVAGVPRPDTLIIDSVEGYGFFVGIPGMVIIDPLRLVIKKGVEINLGLCI